MRSLLLFAVWFLPLLDLRARDPGAKEPRAVLLRAIKAHGGPEKLAQLRIVHEYTRGTITVLATKIRFTSESLLRMPDQFHIVQKSELRGKKLHVVHVFDGTRGWLAEAGVPKAADANTRATWKELAHAHYVSMLTPLLAADKGYRLTALGESAVKGKKVVGIKVACKGHRDVRLYFDKKSGLLVKKSFQPRPGGKETVQDEIYSAYKEVDGLKRPGHISIRLGGVPHAEIDVISTRFLGRIDDKTFGKP